MKVKIKIRSQLLLADIYADSESNILTYNDSNIEHDVVDFIKKVIDITKNWPEKMMDFSVFDGVDYRVAFEDDSGTIKDAMGFGSTPDNFEDLVALVRKLSPTAQEIILKNFPENYIHNKKIKRGAR